MVATLEHKEARTPDGNTQVILVDPQGNAIGILGKLEAHRNGGHLHLAISVLVFDAQGRLLIQRRALGKYHSGGRWANTCCSHPSPGESIEGAAHRRLKDELGFDCDLTEVFDFTYRVKVGDGLTEHEYDHVLVGRYDGEPIPNPAEVMEYRWASLEELFRSVSLDSRDYAPWFKIILVHLAEMDRKDLRL